MEESYEEAYFYLCQGRPHKTTEERFYVIRDVQSEAEIWENWAGCSLVFSLAL